MNGSKKIAIDNVQAIQHLEIPYPEDGGVVVLRGPNGSGKSTGIQAVHALVGGDEQLAVRDGEVSGEVRGLGVTLRLSVAGRKRATRTGEPEVRSLGASVDPSILVDPGLKDPETADMHRARVLCALAGVPPTTAAFHGLLDPETIDALAGSKARAAASLPEMAAALKRDVEAAAREAEAEQEREETQARSMTAGLSEVDLDGPHDELVLREAAEAAMRAGSEAKGRAQGAQERRQRFAAAKGALDAAAAEGGTLGLEEARAATEAAGAARDEAAGEVERLRAELVVAEGRLREREAERAGAARALAAAEATAASVTAAREVVDAGLGDQGPGPEELQALEDAYQRARGAQERGTLIRAGRKRQAQAQDHVRAAQAVAQRAEEYRSAARGCWDVVAEAVARVAPEGIRFRDGRLVLETARGTTPFSELSEGERWRIALPACIRAVGAGGILAIEQGAFEGLDPSARAYIVDQARTARVTVYTGEATDGPLRVEVLR